MCRNKSLLVSRIANMELIPGLYVWIQHTDFDGYK